MMETYRYLAATKGLWARDRLGYRVRAPGSDAVSARPVAGARRTPDATSRAAGGGGPPVSVCRGDSRAPGGDHVRVGASGAGWGRGCAPTASCTSSAGDPEAPSSPEVAGARVRPQRRPRPRLPALLPHRRRTSRRARRRGPSAGSGSRGTTRTTRSPPRATRACATTATSSTVRGTTCTP